MKRNGFVPIIFIAVVGIIIAILIPVIILVGGWIIVGGGPISSLISKIHKQPSDVPDIQKGDVYKRLSPEGKVMLMELNITNDNFSLNDFKIIDGYGPDYFPGSYDFSAKIISFDGELLGEYGFGDPRRIQVEQGYQGQTFLNEVDFTLTIPHFSESQQVDIYSKNRRVFSIYIPEYFTLLKGKVTGLNGTPVTKTNVEIHDTNTYTDSNGSFEFLVKPGKYTLVVRPSGGINLMYASKSVDVLPGRAVIVDFGLLPCGSVSGKITDKNGNPLAEAWAQIVGSETPRYHVDKDGHYAIPYLKPGNYQVAADVEIGGKHIDLPSKTATVELGKTGNIDFVFGE